jgi:hypothetical protein
MDHPLRWTAGSAYVLVVATLAGLGLVTDSTSLILVAALLSLPASVVAVPAYYAAYGLLALVPGANPSSSSGSASCTADGICTSVAAGDPAPWFLVTADVLGILALTCAAILDLIALRILLRRRSGLRPHLSAHRLR